MPLCGYSLDATGRKKPADPRQQHRSRSSLAAELARQKSLTGVAGWKVWWKPHVREWGREAGRLKQQELVWGEGTMDAVGWATLCEGAGLSDGRVDAVGGAT